MIGKTYWSPSCGHNLLRITQGRPAAYMQHLNQTIRKLCPQLDQRLAGCGAPEHADVADVAVLLSLDLKTDNRLICDVCIQSLGHNPNHRGKPCRQSHQLHPTISRERDLIIYETRTVQSIA